MTWFKKKTREEYLQKRTESVFAELTGEVDFEFTELETVQILNNVRRKLSEHLKNKRAFNLEQSVNYNQKAIEINCALDFIN